MQMKEVSWENLHSPPPPKKNPNTRESSYQPAKGHYEGCSKILQTNPFFF